MTDADPLQAKRIVLTPQSLSTIRDAVLGSNDGAETGGFFWNALSVEVHPGQWTPS